MTEVASAPSTAGGVPWLRPLDPPAVPGYLSRHGAGAAVSGACMHPFSNDAQQWEREVGALKGQLAMERRDKNEREKKLKVTRDGL